jgi:hypothetical protein
MNSVKFYIRFLLKTAFILIIAFSLISCGKENGSGSKNTADQVSDINSGINTKDTSVNFIIKYDLSGKRIGKMEFIRDKDKFKQEMDYESGGVKAFSQMFFLNDTVFTVIRSDGRKVGSRSAYNNFMQTYSGNELFVGTKDFSKYLDTVLVLGKEKILGYDCEIFELSDKSTVYVYNRRYPLKIMKAIYIATATELLINPMIDQTEFKLPDDLEYHDKDKRIIKFGTKEDSIAYYNKK